MEASNYEKETWTCDCGQTNLTSAFCPNCGKKRKVENSTWNCSNCGKEGIESRFCPECGTKKGEL